VYSALLFDVNAFIAHRLFTLEYSVHLESNEGAFMAISRIMASHPLDLFWWPYWSAGIPFQYTYFPLFHAIVAVVSRFTGCSPALSFHAVSGTFYCLGPVTLFLLAAVISKRFGYSFCAALLYSLVSPANFLSNLIRDDCGGLWNARRLQALGYYGEAPHLTAVTFLPIAILCIYLALKTARKGYYLASGVATAAVVLTNAFGTVDLFLAVLCLLCLFEGKAFWRSLKSVVLIGIATYLMVSPILLPSLLGVIRHNSQFAGGDYRFTALSAFGVAILLAAYALCWFGARWWKPPAHLVFFALLSVFFVGIPLLALNFGINVVRQPLRYQLELELALCPLLLFAGELVLKRMPGWIVKVALGCLLVLCARQTLHYTRYAKRLIAPIDITATTEYQLPIWVGQHLGNQRVMVTSTQSFLFNVFTDTPQMHGGFDTTDPNWMHQIAVFTVLSGMNAGSRDAEISILWLKAFGAQAVAVPYPDVYKAFTHPRKFDGVLPVLWRDDAGTVLYAVPSRSSSLAHVIPVGSLVRRTPVHGLDVDELAHYVAALDNAALPLAAFTWKNSRSFGIQTTARPDQAVSVQITWHPGWHARANGRDVPVERDAIGLMAIQPHCDGICAIEMYYDGGAELKIALLLSLATLLACLVLFGRRFISGSPSTDIG
jgi:hypothetical protein